MTPAHKPSANEGKLRQLIIYIAKMSERDDAFGAIKLNKLLFNADFTAYAKWGKPLTGVPYFALENGPAPRPMKRLLRALQIRGDIAIQRRDYYDFEQHRVLGLIDVDLTETFEVQEINLVFEMIQKYWGKSAKSMSDESHEFLGWSAADLEETIPYEVALIGTRGPTKDEIRRGLELESMAKEALAGNASRKAAHHHRGA
jgi:hypothetical protein